MWLRSRSPQFIHHLLSFPVAEAAWKRSMVEMQQPTSRLTFCCVAAQLINLFPGRQRVPRSSSLHEFTLDFLTTSE